MKLVTMAQAPTQCNRGALFQYVRHVLSQAGRAASHAAVIGALGSFSATAAYAAAAEGAKFTVPDVMREMLESHPAVSSRKLDTQASEKLVDAARKQFYPTPSAGVETGKGGVGTVFRLTQPVWTNGHLSAQLRAAQLRAERSDIAVTELNTTLASRVLDLCQAYVLNDKRFQAQEASVSTLVSLAAMIERRVQAQVSPDGDRVVVQARLAQARVELEHYRASRLQAEEQLSKMLDKPVNLAALRWEAPATPLRTMAAYLEDARLRSPASRLARVDALVSEQEAAVARAAKYPSVNLAAERAKYAGTGQSTNNRVYLSMNYSLGAGLSVMQQAEAAELKARSAVQTQESAERQTSDAIVAEWQSLQSAQARKGPQADALRGAVSVVDSSRRLFVAGRRSWLDLLNAARELAQAQLGQADIETALVGSRYRLELLSGAPVWELGKALP